MPHIFQLFWLRETGCDAGTLLRADDVAPEIQEPVLALAPREDQVTVLRLPFLDKNEWRRRGEILAGLSWCRTANEIRPMLSPHAAVRDLAAHYALNDLVWADVPLESDLQYFRTWQAVSMTLQRSLRTWIAEAYFEEITRFEDRVSANSMLVYEAARLFHGKPPMDFTYDLRDYPHCLLTLALATKMTGKTLQANLAHVERRLHDAGTPVAARRYAPVWYADIQREVRAKPRRFIELLAAERRFINAVIELGANRTVAGVNHFAKAASQALRNVYGLDLRPLALRALRLATEVLTTEALATDALSEQNGMVEENPHECLRTP